MFVTRDFRIVVVAGCFAAALVSASCGGGGGSTAAVPVSTPGFSLSSNSLNFGNQAVNTSSASLTATLTNAGSATLTISGIQVTGSNASDFALSDDCGASLASSADCTLSIKFTPSSTGNRTASITFTDNAVGSPQTITLAGTGTSGELSLSAGSLAFGSQPVGTSATAQTVTLSNNGSSTLSLTSIAVTGTDPGDFPETNTCGSSLAAGAPCAVSVTFKPAATGSRTAQLSISFSGSGSPQTVGLSGTGTATAPVASFSPTSLTFASQAVGATSAAQTVTLNNTGNATLTLTSIALTGTNPGDFAQANNCGSSLAAGASCALSVTFKPTASGSRNAAVTVTDNAAGSPQNVSLTGTGAATGTVSLSATVLTYGNQPVGASSTPQSVTLTNGSGSSVTVNSVQITGTNAGDFAITSNACTASVAVNGSCAVSITFTPTTSGPRSATVSFTDSATNSPQTVSLTGTGTAPVGGLSPSSFAFGNQPIAIQSTTEAFTLSNTGNGTLSITGITFSGTNAGDFAQNTTCGATLAANTSCTIAVVFTPAGSGSRSGTLVVTDNSNNVASSTQTATLTGTGVHDVVLTWTASPTSGISGYDIFRGTSAEAESTTPLNSTPVDATTYVDSNVTAGQTYYYVVSAVASNGTTQSSVSNEASATVPTP